MARIHVPGVSVKQTATPDFYVATDGDDILNDGLTPATAKLTITAGMALMTGTSQILQIQDGTYSSSDDFILNTDLDAAKGASGAWNIIQAQSTGGVTIGQRFGQDTSNNDSVYIEFHGIRWKPQSGSGRTSFGRDHIKCFDCGFRSVGLYTGEVGGIAMSGDNHLYEDCWFYGDGGRSLVGHFDHINITFRGCFFVFSPAWGWISGANEPLTIFTVYPANITGSVGAVMENCMFVDSTDYDNPDAIGQGFGRVNQTMNLGSNGQTDIYWDSCGFVNNESTQWRAEGGTVDIGETQHINCFYVPGSNGTSGFNFQLSNAGSAAIVKQNLFAGFSGTAITVNAVDGTLTADQNVVYDCGTAFVDSTGTINGSDNAIWGNGVDNNPGTAITGDKSAQILYPMRIESGGSLHTDGPGSTRVGCEVMYRKGVRGTMYPDAGWDTQTTVKLWPWRNEALIYADIREVKPCIQLTFSASGYTNFTSGDRLTTLTNTTDSATVGVLLDYNNTSREAIVRSADDNVPTVAISKAVSAASGNGGTTSQASVKASDGGKRGAGADSITITDYLFGSLGNAAPGDYYSGWE